MNLFGTNQTQCHQALKIDLQLIMRKYFSFLNPKNIILNSKKEPTKDLDRNMRCVWEINTQPFSGSHFATFPKN